MKYKTIYLDFDGCIVNTIKAVCDLYNEDFQYYKKFVPVKWWEVNTWDFQECNCAKSKYLNTYFNQKRFFDALEFMPCAKEVINLLSEVYKVKIVSMGYSPNLKGKEIWLSEKFPKIEFVGINMKHHSDKSMIDMSDGLLIDDNSNNLFSSNALEKICYGDKYAWNDDWKGKRMTWKEIEEYLLRL